MGAQYDSDLNLNKSAYIPAVETEEEAEQEEQESTSFESRHSFNLRDDAPKAVHRRRRWTNEEKKAIVRETEGPGASISAVARKYGIAPRLLFAWRRQLTEELALTVKSGAKIVPISVVKDLETKIQELEEALARKQEEVDALSRALAMTTNAKTNSETVSAS
ncbi:MAG: transposase [Candidatus Obscuribacterales bacterium]